MKSLKYCFHTEQQQAGLCSSDRLFLSLHVSVVLTTYFELFNCIKKINLILRVGILITKQD